MTTLAPPSRSVSAPTQPSARVKLREQWVTSGRLASSQRDIRRRNPGAANVTVLHRTVGQASAWAGSTGTVVPSLAAWWKKTSARCRRSPVTTSWE